MTKAELIDQVAAESGMSKPDAKKAIDVMFAVLGRNLVKEGDSVNIGFGTLRVIHRKERLGRNPQTGEAMKIEARDIITFRQSKSRKKD